MNLFNFIIIDLVTHNSEVMFSVHRGLLGCISQTELYRQYMVHFLYEQHLSHLYDMAQFRIKLMHICTDIVFDSMSYENCFANTYPDWPLSYFLQSSVYPHMTQAGYTSVELPSG